MLTALALKPLSPPAPAAPTSSTVGHTKWRVMPAVAPPTAAEPPWRCPPLPLPLALLPLLLALLPTAPLAPPLAP